MARLKFWPARQANPEGRMSVLDHLRELRRRLIIVFLIVAAGAVIGWLTYNRVIDVLKDPYCNVPYTHRFAATSQSDCALQFRDPLSGLTIRLKVSFMTGAVLTAPFWLYQIWGFVTPGLRKNERRWTIVFITASTVLFAAGMALAYVTLSKSLSVLITSAGDGVKANLDVASYISFVMLMLVIFGASFELPLLIVLLNAARVLPYSLLKKSQRIAIFLIFVFAAVATPSTDPFTMIGMAIPMCLLFELSVLWAYIHDKRRDKRLQAEAESQLPDDVASDVNPIPEPVTAKAGATDDPEWTELP
jgi:sec-independent protein translocase protein TatC